MEFYFVRSCDAPKYNESANPRLTEFGVLQADQLAEMLVKEICRKGREVFVFNYFSEACVETARIIANKFRKITQTLYEFKEDDYDWLSDWINKQISSKAEFVTIIFVVDPYTVRYFPQEKLKKGKNHEFGFYLSEKEYKTFSFEYVFL